MDELKFAIDQHFAEFAGEGPCIELLPPDDSARRQGIARTAGAVGKSAKARGEFMIMVTRVHKVVRNNQGLLRYGHGLVLQDDQLAELVPKRFWLAKTGVDPRVNWCPAMDQTKWLVGFHFLIEFLVFRAGSKQFDADDGVNWIDFQKAILSGLATSGIRTLEDWTEFKVLVGAVSKLMEAVFRPFIVQRGCSRWGVAFSPQTTTRPRL
jgi:hypothetical protein